MSLSKHYEGVFQSFPLLYAGGKANQRLVLCGRVSEVSAIGKCSEVPLYSVGGAFECFLDASIYVS